MAEARRLWHRAAARDERAVEGSSLKRLALMERIVLSALAMCSPAFRSVWHPLPTKLPCPYGNRRMRMSEPYERQCVP